MKLKNIRMTFELLDGSKGMIDFNNDTTVAPEVIPILLSGTAPEIVVATDDGETKLPGLKSNIRQMTIDFEYEDE